MHKSDSINLISRVFLQETAKNLNLEFIGVVSIGKLDAYKYFSTWLDSNYHAEMSYLERHKHCRENPNEILPEAKCALILAMPYYQGDKLLEIKKAEKPAIAQYARQKDYHKTFKKKLEQFFEKIKEKVPDSQFRITVDSAPILERALAVQGESGFIGKNTLFIHPKKGSFFLLGEILCDLDLKQDERKYVDPNKRSELGGCGSCRRCQVNCPTGALSKDYVLDANKCISYYTIEHRGVIPVEFWWALKFYIFGCDLCQLACPYNRGVKSAVDNLWINKSMPSLPEMVTMSQNQYETWFGGTPLTRAKIAGLKRNALISMIVRGDPQVSELKNVIYAEGLPLLISTLNQIPKFQEMLEQKSKKEA